MVKEIQPDTAQTSPSHAALVGSICHRVLEEWDFHGTSQELQRMVESVVKWSVNFEMTREESSAQFQNMEYIKTEAVKILSVFMNSEAYKELQIAEILGREVFILLHWNGQIMRGSIDILYKIGDRIIIADYKTDYVATTGLPAKAEEYAYQKTVYVEAARRCLKIDNPEFKLIFLRAGKAVTIS
ncbi:MAG: PD-(D/E)XK nuclease family protein [Candidatus Brocadiaceae bacterium]|nr:PD-(D/E)XK nuclease family protein [Candidatus Brocadiaceae bacterium]